MTTLSTCGFGDIHAFNDCNIIIFSFFFLYYNSVKEFSRTHTLHIMDDIWCWFLFIHC